MWGGLKAWSVEQRSSTYWSFLVDGLDDKLFVIEGNVPDFTPGEADLWWQPEVTIQSKVSWQFISFFSSFVSLAVLLGTDRWRCGLIDDLWSHWRSWFEYQLDRKGQNLQVVLYDLREPNDVCYHFNFWVICFQFKWKCIRTTVGDATTAGNLPKMIGTGTFFIDYCSFSLFLFFLLSAVPTTVQMNQSYPSLSVSASLHVQR